MPLPMKLDRPIILVGTGRCGSTALHKALARHPNVAWLSPLCERFPGRPAHNRRLMRLLGRSWRGRLLPMHPYECYGFWDHHCRGFGTPFRDLRAEDVTVRARRNVREALSAMLTRQRRRMLLKITGWPRLGYLKELFPDARFIHVVRDGRAVAASLMQVPWWWGWRGPENWRWGTLEPVYRDVWERHGQSFVALAALEWRLLTDAFRRTQAEAGEQLLEVRYEHLCERPEEVFAEMLRFCDLPAERGFMDYVCGLRFENRNDKWRRDFTAKQIATMEAVLEEPLRHFGYRTTADRIAV